MGASARPMQMLFEIKRLSKAKENGYWSGAMAKWIKLQSKAGQKGRRARAEIEVGTREKTKAVMLRKEGLSWRPHPSL